MYLLKSIPPQEHATIVLFTKYLSYNEYVLMEEYSLVSTLSTIVLTVLTGEYTL